MSEKDQILPQKPVRLGSGVWTSHSGVLPSICLLLFTSRPGRRGPWGWRGAGELRRGEGGESPEALVCFQ